MYQMQDVNVAYNYFLEHILEILEEEAPMTKVQISKKHKNWISQGTRTQMSERNSMRDKLELTTVLIPGRNTES